MAQDDPADLHLVGEATAAMVGEAGIVVADDPGPVEAARQLDEQLARIRRQALASQSWKLSPRQKRRVARAFDRAASAVSVACDRTEGRNCPRRANQLAFSRCVGTTSSAFWEGQNSARQRSRRTFRLRTKGEP